MLSILFFIGIVILFISVQIKKAANQLSGMDLLATNEAEFNDLMSLSKPRPSGIIEFPFDLNDKIQSPYSDESYNFIRKETLVKNKLKGASGDSWETVSEEYLGRDSIFVYDYELPMDRIKIGDRPEKIHTEKGYDENTGEETKITYYGINCSEETFTLLGRVINGEIKDTLNQGNEIEIVGSSSKTYIKTHDKFIKKLRIVGVLLTTSIIWVTLLQVLFAFIAAQFGG